MYPAAAVGSLRVDSAGQTAGDVLECLRPLGGALDIPRRLVSFIGDYMRTYLVDGAPDFSGGTYFERVYRQCLRHPRLLHEIGEIDELCSQRLTAAMVGLLRSFTVSTFDTNDPPGQVMRRALSQPGVATQALMRSLHEDLAEVRARLRGELWIGVRHLADDLGPARGRLFECGWS